MGSAWQAGPQTQSLRDQLVAMPKDGVFIITIPAKPYRCPPGPYERACVVADWIKANKRSTGSTSPQVIILDANPSIQAEAANFTTAFTKIHAGVIKYVPNATVQAVNADTRTITTTAGRFTGHVLNVIPDHTAGRIARDAGLATSMTAAGGAFCPVDVLTYESLVRSGIHVLGDASATSQPKAGHVANQEAKVCADAIVRLMASPALPVDQAPITNSACYSPNTATTASWLSVVYHYDHGQDHGPGRRAATGSQVHHDRQLQPDEDVVLDADAGYVQVVERSHRRRGSTAHPSTRTVLALPARNTARSVAAGTCTEVFPFADDLRRAVHDEAGACAISLGEMQAGLRPEGHLGYAHRFARFDPARDSASPHNGRGGGGAAWSGGGQAEVDPCIARRCAGAVFWSLAEDPRRPSPFRRFRSVSSSGRCRSTPRPGRRWRR